MANIQSVLKAEVTRIARKEIRAEVQRLKSASIKYRTDIASLKRQVAALEGAVKKAERVNKRTVPASDAESTKQHRFSPKRLAAQRKRLELSAAAMGKLLGVTGLSVYAWESGKSRPRDRHLPAISSLAKLKPGQAAEIVASR